MKSFQKYILKEFSSIQNNYSKDYREYKEGLIKELERIAPPSFRGDYWKNIKLDFLSEEWKYVKSNRINDGRLLESYFKELLGVNNYINIVFINGFLHSMDNDLPVTEDIKIEKITHSYDELFEKKQEVFSFFKKENLLKNWFLCLNEVLNDEVITLRIPQNSKLKRTVRMIYITDNDDVGFITCPQVFFNVEDGAKLNLIEEHFSIGRSLNNHSLKFSLGKDTTVRHLLFQNESQTSIHINHTYVEQKQNSNYHSYILQKGAKNSIVQKTINLAEPQSNCELNGLSHPKEQQAFSNLTKVSHLAPDTKSDQVYRGILEDDSFLNFSGIVRVDQEAPLTNSTQLNQNLFLSNRATAISRPRLEIHNDDVKCTHGATSRDMDPQELFYLISRGINPQACKELMIKGFTNEFYKHIWKFFPEWKT